jgi:orotidine-5'-phosphate decarboxylase
VFPLFDEVSNTAMGAVVFNGFNVRRELMVWSRYRLAKISDIPNVVKEAYSALSEAEIELIIASFFIPVDFQQR